MKTNEINSNVINTRINLEEISKLKEPKIDDKPIVKKDIVHITESKRESNILDKKLSPLELPLKVEKPFVINKKVTTFAAALREEHGLEELKRGQ